MNPMPLILVMATLFGILFGAVGFGTRGFHPLAAFAMGALMLIGIGFLSVWIVDKLGLSAKRLTRADWEALQQSDQSIPVSAQPLMDTRQKS